jgi:hypothetical protein
MARSPDLINFPIIRGCGVALLLAVALVNPGCQLAFGTYNTGSGDAGVTTGGTATSGGGTSANGGAAVGGGTSLGSCDGAQPFTCRGADLLKCVNKQWERADTCTKPAFCEPSLGVCYKCATDDATRCAPVGDGGGIGISSCIDPLVGFSVPTAACEAPLYCAPGVPYCVFCEPKEAHCTGSTTAKVCSDDRTALQNGNCPGGCINDGTRDVCVECVDGTKLCTPNAAQVLVLRACVGGGWKTIDCANGCQPAVGDNPATCIN